MEHFDHTRTGKQNTPQSVLHQYLAFRKAKFSPNSSDRIYNIASAGFQRINRLEEEARIRDEKISFIASVIVRQEELRLAEETLKNYLEFSKKSLTRDSAILGTIVGVVTAIATFSFKMPVILGGGVGISAQAIKEESQKNFVKQTFARHLHSKIEKIKCFFERIPELYQAFEQAFRSELSRCLEENPLFEEGQTSVRF